MDPYDSDSSLEEEDEFTETGVLLGFPAEEIIEDTISHLGGWPTWIDDASLPPGDFANCKVCNRPMLLLLELHGDLPEHFPNHERRLYIFGCPRKPCNRKPGSIRALRATRKINKENGQQQKQKEEENKANPNTTENNAESKTVEEKPKQDLGASLFAATSLTGNLSSNPNPFSSSTDSPAAAGSNPFSTTISAADKSSASQSSTSVSANALAETFADKVRVSSPPPGATTTTTTKPTPESAGPPTPWPGQSAFPTPYKQFYLDAEYETLSRPPTPKIPANITVESMDEEAGSGSATELKDTFESELDKTFMKFSARLAHNPEQVLRYEFRGSPLLYSHTDPVGKRLHRDQHPEARVTTIATGAGRMPPCEYCGSERVFELQLVPHAISVLEEGREGVGLGKDDAGMEWGTIILGVCARDCVPLSSEMTGWREEWAGVQWEETR